jgi:hypothetical protein
MEDNTTLKAIVSIRNLVMGLASEWQLLKTTGAELDANIEEASRLFLNNALPDVHERWLTELGQVRENVIHLKEILRSVTEKINAKESSNLSELWNNHMTYSSNLINRLTIMEALGQVHLNKQLHGQWQNIWEEAHNKFSKIQKLVQASSLQLAMITEYTPQEIDTLTETILRNMPIKYTQKEAAQYEKEYMAAFNQIQQEASQKKNLWDRFLDILAGGAQQSPAQMVMMQRWINGEKGEL